MRGPSPGAGGIQVLRGDGVAGEHVVAVDLHAGHAEPAEPQVQRDARLHAHRHRDRPLVVLQEEHLRGLEARGEHERLADVALRGGAVAEVDHDRFVGVRVPGAARARRRRRPSRIRWRAASASRPRACRGGSSRSPRVPAAVGDAAEQFDDAAARRRRAPCRRRARGRPGTGGPAARAACAEPIWAASWPMLGTHSAELALPLQVRGLHVEAAGDDHVAVEACAARHRSARRCTGGTPRPSRRCAARPPGKATAPSSRVLPRSPRVSGRFATPAPGAHATPLASTY